VVPYRLAMRLRSVPVEPAFAGTEHERHTDRDRRRRIGRGDSGGDGRIEERQ